MTALIGNHNIEIYQGADFSYTITIKDNLGAAINLTGCTFSGRIKENYGDTVSYNFSFQNTDLLHGEFRMYMAHTITNTLTFSKGVYEVDITYADGTIDTFLYGSVVIRPQV